MVSVSERIDSLDGLRGLAALTVVMTAYAHPFSLHLASRFHKQ